MQDAQADDRPGAALPQRRHSRACATAETPRSTATRTLSEALQTRTMTTAPPKVWGSGGNGAATGTTSAQEPSQERALCAQDGEPRCWPQDTPPMGPRGAGQKLLRAVTSAAPTFDGGGPLHGAWVHRKGQTTEWAPRCGRSGHCPFTTGGPGGRGRAGRRGAN